MHIMVANILPAEPQSPTLAMGSIGHNSIFLQPCHIAYQSQGNYKSSSMVANILPADPYLSPDPGVNRSKFSFSGLGHVAYQIKENHKCSKMVANILHAYPPALAMGSIGHNSAFSEHGHVPYQIKGNYKISSMVANI